MERGIFRIQLLGVFSMEYNGRTISFERSAHTKTKLLLQILVHAGEKGIARASLIQELFGKSEVKNPSSSLRVTVFRLRKVLAECGLPEDEYVKIEKGIYYWTRDIPTYVDALEFESLVLKAKEEKDEEKRALLLESACRKYTGEFLPLLSAEEWAIFWNVHYKNIFISCMKELCEIFDKQKKYEQLLPHCVNAATLYPFDEWQIAQITCLVHLGRKEEAIQVYQNTSKMFFEELGIMPSERMMNQFEQMCGKIQNVNSEIGQIQQNLDEKEEAVGAFYCNYPSFVESYRYIKRVIERLNQTASLMLCTITDGKGNTLEHSEKLNEFSQELKNAIISSIRKGDLYTQYSPNQYLILLFGTAEKDCDLVKKRINSHLEKSYRKNYLDYHIASIFEVEQEEGEPFEKMLEKGKCI